MSQTVTNVLRSACGAALIAVAACSATPTEPAADLSPNTHLQSSAPAAGGVFIGGGAAAPSDTTTQGESRGVFIGGGM